MSDQAIETDEAMGTDEVYVRTDAEADGPLETVEDQVGREAATGSEAPVSPGGSDVRAPRRAEVTAEVTAEASAADSDERASEDSVSDEGVSESSAPPSGRVAILEREGEIAADFLETLLDICDLDGDLDVDIDGDRAAVSIVDSDEGRVPRRLVGPEGRTLDALQELTRLAVQRETGDRSRLMLDIAEFRASRRRELVEIARDAAAQVKSTGESVALRDMSAFERKVVHDEVLAQGLGSQSEGAEPRRHVVVLPAS